MASTWFNYWYPPDPSCSVLFNAAARLCCVKYSVTTILMLGMTVVPGQAKQSNKQVTRVLGSSGWALRLILAAMGWLRELELPGTGERVG